MGRRSRSEFLEHLKVQANYRAEKDDRSEDLLERTLVGSTLGVEQEARDSLNTE